MSFTGSCEHSAPWQGRKGTQVTHILIIGPLWSAGPASQLCVCPAQRPVRRSGRGAASAQALFTVLLGMSDAVNTEIERALLEKHEILRPGYTRFSLPFWLNELELEHILMAVEFVASHGVHFLPYYRYNHKTGEWAHSTRLTKFPERKWLSKFELVGPALKQEASCFEPGRLDEVLKETREAAERELAATRSFSLAKKVQRARRLQWRV